MAKKTDDMIEEAVTRIMRLPIEVTQACIDEAQCGLPSRCMLAVAVHKLLRKLPGQDGKHHYVKVANGNVWWSYEGRRYRASLPPKVIRNYIAFDEQRPVRPFPVALIGQDVGPVTKKTRAAKDRINELRRARIAAGNKPKKSELRKRLSGVVVPGGRRPKAA